MKDDSQQKIDKNSFFNFHYAESHSSEPEILQVDKSNYLSLLQLQRQPAIKELQKSDQINLVCTTGTNKRTFSIYTMPEAQQETEQPESTAE